MPRPDSNVNLRRVPVLDPMPLLAAHRLRFTPRTVLLSRGFRERHHVLLEPLTTRERLRVAVVFDEIEPERDRLERREVEENRAAGLAGFELQAPRGLEGAAARVDELHVGEPAETLDLEV